MANSNSKHLLISHLFAAPCEDVFRAWVDPEQLQYWYAPEGCTIEFKSLDARPGGRFHSCIHDPVHGDCWIIGEYKEVLFPVRLVFTMVLANADGEPVSSNAAGKSDEWPEQIITTVTFESIGDQTKLTLHQTVDEEEAKRTGAYQSWFSMFDRLEKQLEKNS